MEYFIIGEILLGDSPSDTFFNSSLKYLFEVSGQSIFMPELPLSLQS